MTAIEKILDLEAEKQEVSEFIKLFQAMPKEKRRDVKCIMIGVNLMCQEQAKKNNMAAGTNGKI